MKHKIQKTASQPTKHISEYHTNRQRTCVCMGLVRKNYEGHLLGCYKVFTVFVLNKIIFYIYDKETTL
jgi:hypothetical protein